MQTVVTRVDKHEQAIREAVSWAKDGYGHEDLHVRLKGALSSTECRLIVSVHGGSKKKLELK